MPSYTGLQFLYMLLQLLNVLLLVFLITTILKSKAYFTKWTLFQICVCTFFEQVSGLPTLLVYGTEIQQRAYDTSICIIQQKVASFFMIPFQVLPAILIFYLWFALVKNNTDIEQNYGQYISGVVWLLTIVRSIIQWILDSEHEHWDTEVNKLGIVLFLIFGTTKSPTIFLPCCYYAPTPPSKVRSTLSSPLSPFSPSSPFYTAANNINRPARILSTNSNPHKSPPQTPLLALDSLRSSSPGDKDDFNYKLTRIV
ncbi:2610_t:CDS:2 [Ambispora gerdemannii]|uniref:2610_t:CDS:1 n=1 Tax=Ambispora gerdemannii TaxID=144530 RepID=A0A9N9FG81_9GLOM|nr:2610_t:CDS:2 [Ambispora gerdemannii]